MSSAAGEHEFVCTRGTLSLFRGALVATLFWRRRGLVAACLLVALVGALTPFRLLALPALAFPLLLGWQWRHRATQVLRPLTEPGTAYRSRPGEDGFELVTPVNRVHVRYDELTVLRRSPVTLVVAQEGSGMISVLPAEIVDADMLDQIGTA